MKLFLIPLAMGLVAQATFANAADCPDVKTVEKGKLTVAAYDYPPFTVIGPNNSISGVDPDIVKRAAKDACLEVVSMVMEPAATIQAVIAGKADVAIGSWNRTEKRSQVLGLSAPIYLDPMGMVSKDGIDTIDGLKGKTVGTVTGYLWVTELQKLVGGSLKLYPNDVAVDQDLAAGRIDVGLVGYSAAALANKAGKGYKDLQVKIAKPDEAVQASVQPAQAGILYTKGNDSLGKALDESIKKQQAGGLIGKDLEALGIDKAVADVGEPRLVK